MRYRAGLPSFALGMLLAGCASRPVTPAAAYGSPSALEAPTVTLEQALSDANLGRTLTVKARVSEVCQMKGCWMVLTDDARSARITFRDYAFFVPKDLVGKKVIAEGVLSRRVLSAEDAEHLAKESGAPAPSPPPPREEWSLVASSVVVLAGP